MGKKKMNVGVPPPTNQQEWSALMEMSGIKVIDVHCSWAGPCQAMEAALKRIQMKFQVLGMGEFISTSVCSTNIEQLNIFNRSCKPVFLLYNNAELNGVVQGANAEKMRSELIKLLKDEEFKSTASIRLEDFVPKDERYLDNDFEEIEEAERREAVKEETGLDFWINGCRVLIHCPVGRAVKSEIKKVLTATGFTILENKKLSLNSKHIAELKYITLEFKEAYENENVDLYLLRSDQLGEDEVQAFFRVGEEEPEQEVAEGEEEPRRKLCSIRALKQFNCMSSINSSIILRMFFHEEFTQGKYKRAWPTANSIVKKEEIENDNKEIV